MLMMALPSIFSPVASVIGALVALVAGLSFVKRSNVIRPYDTTEQAIADITLKVRSPWQYRVRQVERMVKGE